MKIFDYWIRLKITSKLRLTNQQGAYPLEGIKENTQSPKKLYRVAKGNLK
jgi:hypothetical protein